MRYVTWYMYKVALCIFVLHIPHSCTVPAGSHISLKAKQQLLPLPSMLYLYDGACTLVVLTLTAERGTGRRQPTSPVTAVSPEGPDICASHTTLMHSSRW